MSQPSPNNPNICCDCDRLLFDNAPVEIAQATDPPPAMLEEKGRPVPVSEDLISGASDRDWRIK